MESMGESRTIWQSIENIAGMHGSLKAFWTALLEELDVIGGADMDFVPYKGHSLMAPGNWVYVVECRTYKLQGRDGGDEGVLKGVVSIKIELWREADEHGDSAWSHAKTPLVYVAFHRYPDPGSDEVSYYGIIKAKFGLDQHGKPYREGEDVPYRARTPLWIWDDIPDDVDEWIDSSWFFAVPLVEIGSYDALREQITEPLRQLLFENRPPEDVFGDRRAIPTVAAEGP